MEFQELIKKAKQVRDQYSVLNRLEGYKTWSATEYAQGLVGDVGDLQKQLLAKKGFWFTDKNVDDKLGRELADCLWGILAIADELDVDISGEFSKTLKRLEGKILDRGVVKSKKKQL